MTLNYSCDTECVCVIYNILQIHYKNFLHAVLKINVSYFLTIKFKGKVHSRTGHGGLDVD